MSKNANGQGHIRQRKPDLWEGQYSVREDGKRKLRSVYGKTQAEVRKKLSAVVNEIDTGTYISPDKSTVGQWFDTWAAEYLKNVKDSSKEMYLYHGKHYIKPDLGEIKIQKLTSPMVQKFINNQSVSASSVKLTFSILNRCLTQAVQCGIIRVNPCLSCVLPRKKKHEMYTISDVPGFLKAIRGDSFERFFTVVLFTGMREGESLGLTWDCVDFKNGTIRIEKQLRESHLGKVGYEFANPKSGKTRIIRPAKLVMECLKQEKKTQAENKLKVGKLFNNADNLVFTTEFGKHLNRCTVRDHLKKAVSAIGCEKVRFHDLRHTYATISIQNGDDIKTVSENLGHASIVITLDIYSHVTEEMRKNSSERMDAYISNLANS